MKRQLGRSGIEVSALGMGCWAIGGPHSRHGRPVGWGKVDDDESIRALRRAFDLGVTFFDTADVYGCGHSEEVLARALGDVRPQIVIASKAGFTYVEGAAEAPGENGDPQYIRQCCDHSLRRLKTDRIDLYQFHLGHHPIEKAPEVLSAFEDLVAAGKVRYIGWSTDDPARAELFAQSPACTAIQQMLNVFEGSAATLEVCEKHCLASINRGPLAKGLLTGKFTSQTRFADDDIRNRWDLERGVQAAQLRRLEAVREVLCAGGRTLAQASLAWLWARSPATIPIPGFKTVAQVEENAGAMQFGPLSQEQMRQIAGLLTET